MRGIYLALLLPTVALAAAPPDPVDVAIRRGLRRLEQGATNYVINRQCFSCHHQSLTIEAMVTAKRLGFEVSQRVLDEQLEFTIESFKPNLDKIRKGENIGGRSTTAAYALFTLQVAGQPADDVTNTLIEYLALHQEDNGSWPAVTQRNPSEGSRFTNAALALSALQYYGSMDGTKNPRTEAMIQRGTNWLLKNTARDTEDRVFRLRALTLIKDAGEQRKEAMHDLLEQQLADGSWRQLPDQEGDAYATATALVALKRAGLDVSDSRLRNGIRYLLRTQTAEGAWIVQTRSKPIQRWFDNGDPGGKSQFISFLATGWATLALLESRPAK